MGFEQFSGEHLAALAAIAAACALAVAGARRDAGASWVRPAALALAAALVGCQVWLWVARGLSGDLSLQGDLPLHLTDASTFAGAYALVRPSALAFELTYFWGLAGVPQALVTPDLRHGFPDHRWVIFFVAHGGVVLAALLLAFGLRRTPRPGAVRRIFLITLGFAAVVFLVNLAVDANYMFLRRPPSTGSLLDVMGPWPWYIGSAALLALALLALLDLPFRRRPARAGTR